MSEDLVKTEFIECECRYKDHVLKIEFENDDDVPIFSVSILMSHYHGFFARIWLAIKYVFGWKCEDSHWDTFIFDEKGANKLDELIVQYQIAMDKRKKRYCVSK